MAALQRYSHQRATSIALFRAFPDVKRRAACVAQRHTGCQRVLMAQLHLEHDQQILDAFRLEHLRQE